MEVSMSTLRKVYVYFDYEIGDTYAYTRTYIFS